MSAMMTGRDKDLLRYMTDLKVEELRHPSDPCKITLSFGSNPYFQNEVIVKEYLVSISGKRRLPGRGGGAGEGYRASQSTPVQWHQGFEREAYRRRQHNSSLNFFNWFSDHSPAGSSRIAEIISKDLWPNPLHYYLRRKAPGRGAERRTGEEPVGWVLK
ncbi:hypothetical protein CB1_000025001 [Camelus ferus]|nr:hypothetical protein CB1_000025001 [Camelus ferus]